MIYKFLSSEVECNTTPAAFASSRVVRISSVDDAAPYEITQTKDTRKHMLTINASANGTTLITTHSTQDIKPGHLVFGSSNLAVVNTDIASQVVSVINGTAFSVNVDIVVANGVCDVYTKSGDVVFSIFPGREMFIEKDFFDHLNSDDNANVFISAVAVRG